MSPVVTPCLNDPIAVSLPRGENMENMGSDTINDNQESRNSERVIMILALFLSFIDVVIVSIAIIVLAVIGCFQ